MKQHKHRGHCQVCGRIQAVDVRSGDLAKHGYTVKGWGFFMGVCRGSNEKPLEQSRVITDAIIKLLLTRAAEADTLAERLRTGILIPAKVRHPWKQHWDEVRRVTVYEYTTWKAATVAARRAEVARQVSEQEFEARQSRAHITMLRGLIDMCHGKPLLPAERRLPPIEVKPGDKFTLHGKEYTVHSLVRSGFSNNSLRAICTTPGNPAKVFIGLTAVRAAIRNRGK